MSRRNLVNVSIENVHTLKAVVHQIQKPFNAKVDPCASLASEIEACRKKIWNCVQADTGSSNRVPKKLDASVNVVKPVEVPSPTKSSQHRGNAELRVFALKVVELKQELKTRGLETNGLKKDLRTRLLNAILADVESTQDQENDAERQLCSPEKAACVDAEVAAFPNSGDAIQHTDDDNMEESRVFDDSSPKVEESGTESDHEMKRNSGQAAITDSDSSVGKSSQTSRDYWMNKVKPSPAPMNETKDAKQQDPSHSSSKSPLRGVVKNAFKVFGNYGQSKAQCPPDRLDDPADDISPPSSEVSNCSKISGTKVRELVSKISGTSSYQSTQNGGSALSKNLQAKKEARLARMAEIREKSKPLAGNKVALTPKEYTSTLSSLNATAASTTGKTKDLAAMRAQMREKAAASKLRKENIPANSNKLRKENIPTNSNSQSSLMSSGKRNLPSAQSEFVPDMLGATVKQGFLKKAKVSSPLDTYEISDREDSDTDDSDGSDDENNGAGKKIPSWASKSALYTALEQQYNGRVDGRRVDPDDLFPEVQTCDLEAIFGSRKNARYKSRTSSANWKDDKVTMQEKLVYKRKMGFSTQTSEI
mmetsp:Transcript_97615/g.146272  ORF Transcript_97615/g.146272 Transcript_97615/m.146272 type:complete len:592 (-) Transcript_97615:4-1779(-)